MIKSIDCIIFLFTSFYLYSQEPKYIHYTTDNGLPSSEVYDILQDNKGYIWFATDNGVSRFDGYKFHNYTSEDGLLSRTIFDLYEDYKGRIWFSHENNQLCYFYQDSIFKYKFNKIIEDFLEKQNRGKQYINKIAVDSADNILIIYSTYGATYISNQGKLINMDFYDKNMLLFNYSPIFNISYIIIPYDPELTTVNDINIYINKKQYFIGKISNPYNETVSFNSKKYAFCIGTTLYIFDNNSLISTEIKSLRVIHLTNDGNDLWVGTHPLLGAICYKNADITKLPSKNYLKGYSVSAIYRDKEKGLWFSTIEDGVFYVPNENVQNYSTTSGLTDNHCIQLLVDNEKTIYAGINKRDIFIIDNKKDTKTIRNEMPYNGNLTYQNNLLWIYGFNNTFTLNKKGKLQIRKPLYHNDKHKLFKVLYSNRAYAISSRILLLSSSQGFCYYLINSKGDSIIKIKNCIEKTFIHDFCKYKNGSILAATRNGMYRITPDTLFFENTKTTCLGPRNPKLKVRIDKIIYNNFDHRYWLATREFGIFVWDDKNDSIYVISKNNGLPDNLITSLSNSYENTIFAGTKYGLCQITLNDSIGFSYSLKVFTTKNGINANEINDVVVIDSIVYIATDKGICFFDYKNHLTNNIPPPVYITNLKINENDTTILNDYRLNYDQNNLTIQFVGLAYKACGDILYKFQLQGSDTTWRYTKNTELRYLKLPPGNFLFKVFAQNEDGIWSTNPAIIKFKILPPFWATLWFKIIILLMAFLMIYIAISIKFNIIKKRNQIKIEETEKRHGLEKELMNTRLKALSQQMNPHFVFNTLSAVKLMVIKNENELVMDYLDKFTRIMRMTLDFSRTEFSSVEQTIEYITAYIKIKSINLAEEINCKIKISDMVDLKKENISPMIVQPYIENAIIHGLIPKQQNMQLFIEIKNELENILFIIEDNGIGRSKAEELNKKREQTHKSYGIQITEERIELINKIISKTIKTEITDLFDGKGNPSGTRVSLYFPLA